MLVFAGCLLVYRQKFLIDTGSSYLLDLHRSIAAGTANAPDQYRPLVPQVSALLATFAPLRHVVLLIDTTAVAVGAGAVAVFLHRLGTLRAFPIAAGVFAFWLNTSLYHPRPETFWAFALISAGAALLATDRRNLLGLALVGVLLLGIRADYTAALGVTLILVSLRSRQPRPGMLGAFLLLSAAAATIAWTHVYPRATYPDGTAVVQLGYNLNSQSLLTAALFVGPVLLVPLLLLRRRREVPGWPVVAWFGAEVAATMMVGRIEEIRIFLPFAGAVGAVAAVAYLALRDDRL